MALKTKHQIQDDRGTYIVDVINTTEQEVYPVLYDRFKEHSHKTRRAW